MLDKLIDKASKLTPGELRQLYNHIGSLLPPSVVYKQKPSKCGCKRCKEGGEGHGLYWYGYFSYKGKTRCVYVGKEKREIDPLKEIKRKNINRG